VSHTTTTTTTMPHTGSVYDPANGAQVSTAGQVGPIPRSTNTTSTTTTTVPTV
jgi:hypothetical protein